jgi:hypothetical protein
VNHGPALAGIHESEVRRVNQCFSDEVTARFGLLPIFLVLPQQPKNWSINYGSSQRPVI